MSTNCEVRKNLCIFRSTIN